MGKTKKNRNAKQGIDTMGVSTSEIAKEISKPQTAMPIYESNDDDTGLANNALGSYKKCQKTV